MPLEYHGEIFRVQIILVAKYAKRYHEGTSPYAKRAKTALAQKADSIYVAGREQNMDFVDKVVNAIKNENIGKLEWVRSYKTLDKERNRKNAKMALFRT